MNKKYIAAIILTFAANQVLAQLDFSKLKETAKQIKSEVDGMNKQQPTQSPSSEKNKPSGQNSATQSPDPKINFKETKREIGFRPITAVDASKIKTNKALLSWIAKMVKDTGNKPKSIGSIKVPEFLTISTDEATKDNPLFLVEVFKEGARYGESRLYRDGSSSFEIEPISVEAANELKFYYVTTKIDNDQLDVIRYTVVENGENEGELNTIYSMSQVALSIIMECNLDGGGYKQNLVKDAIKNGKNKFYQYEVIDYKVGDGPELGQSMVIKANKSDVMRRLDNSASDAGVKLPTLPFQRKKDKDCPYEGRKGRILEESKDITSISCGCNVEDPNGP